MQFVIYVTGRAGLLHGWQPLEPFGRCQIQKGTVPRKGLKEPR